MCDPYPCWSPGIEEGPQINYSKRKKYSTYFYKETPRFEKKEKRGNPFSEFFEREIHQDDDDFEFMGLKRSCSEEDLKKQYHKLAKEYHPDKGGTNTLFIRLKNAYENIKRFLAQPF
jgi:hypothetical protein